MKRLYLFCILTLMIGVSLGYAEKAQAAGPYDVGVFYFSNWNPELNHAGIKKSEKLYGRPGDQWVGVKDHIHEPGFWGYGPIPYREPLAGWYDDRQQNVMDRQILQASSRGIDHFAFYYYWKDAGGGERPGQQAVYNFTNSPYKDLMDFYIYFVPDGAWPAADWTSSIVPQFIEFMKDPSYKKTPDGRPVIAFNTNMLAQLGGKTGVQNAIQHLRTAVQNEGLPNPLVMINGFRTLQSYLELGFDGFLTLNLAGLGLDSNQNIPADYATSYPGAWNDFVYADYPPGSSNQNYENVQFIPGGLSAFDARTWGKGHDKYVYADPSPLKFREQLQNIKEYLDTHPRSLNMSTLYAWNENGEGGVLEPTTLDGFGYLNAIQETFGLSNAAYKQKVQLAGLADLDPGLRLEFTPEYAVVTEGQTVKLKGRVTNRFPVTVTSGSVVLDTYGWDIVSSSGTLLNGLAPGAGQDVEFNVLAGAGAPWIKHHLSVSGQVSLTGQTVTESTTTFVVKAPDVYGITEPVQETVLPGSSVDLQVNVRNYSLQPREGEVRLSVPAGWVITDNGTGSFALSGYSGGVHTNRLQSKIFKLAIPENTPAGEYQLQTSVSYDGKATESTTTVNVGDYLANGGFETDSNGDGTADSWSRMGTAGQLTLSSERVAGLKSQKLEMNGYGGGLVQEWFNVQPGKQYIIEGWVKVEKGTLRISEEEGDAQFVFLGTNASKDVTGNAWQKVTLQYTPKQGAAKMSIRLKAWSSGQTVAYVDEMKFYSTSSVPVTGVELDKQAAALSAGQSVSLTAAVIPANVLNQTVAFTSSDPSVATVSAAVYNPVSGTTAVVISGVRAGSAVITATTLDGMKTSFFTVTVTDSLAMSAITAIRAARSH